MLGFKVQNSPGWGSTLKKAVTNMATVVLLCFRKANNDPVHLRWKYAAILNTFKVITEVFMGKKRLEGVA